MNSQIQSLPDGWQLTQLGRKSYIKARLGWKGLKAEEYVNEGFIFLSTPNIKGYQIDFENVNYISERRYLESPEIMLKDGDVLLVKDGSTLGTVNIVRYLPAPTTVNSSIAVIRPNEDLSGLYLYYYIQGEAFQNEILNMKGGLAVPHIFQADLKKFPILLPSLPEQQEIAEILDTIDSTIAHTSTLIAKLKQMKAGLLHDLLTRGLDENGKLRDAIEHPEQFKGSPLGQIPKDWEVEKLGEICKFGGGSIQTGPFGSQLHAEDYKDEGIPIITVEHLGDNEILHSNFPLVGDADYKRLQKYSLQVGDLVFSRVGAIDRCAYVSEDEDGWLFSGRCLRVRPGSCFNSRFLSYQLNSLPCRRWILNNSVGSTMACLNTSILSGLPVLVPPLSEQKAISSILDAQIMEMLAEEAYLNKLKEQKKGLMHDLLTGRVRVTA